MDHQQLEGILHSKRILSVVTIDDPKQAAPPAKPLVKRGVTAMELTLRTPTAMESIERIVN